MSDAGSVLRLGKLKLKTSKETEKKATTKGQTNENSPKPTTSSLSSASSAKPNTSTQSSSSKKLPADIFIPQNAYKTFSLVNEIKIKRDEMFASVLAYPFNHHRCRILSEAKHIPTGSKGILYWVSREQRVQGRNSNIKQIK
jgi:hypothetical protein